MRRLVLSLLFLLAGCAAPGKRYTPMGRVLAGISETVPAGETELQLGYLDGEGGDRAALTGIHWGASTTTELYLDAVPYRRLGRQSVDGLGDVEAGILHRFFEETALVPAGAVRVRVKAPTGNDEKGVSTGEFDATASIIATQHLGGVYGAFTYEVAALGESSGMKLVHRIVLDAGFGLGPGVGLTLEALGSADIEADEEDLDLLAFLEVAVSDSTILDLYGSIPAIDNDGEWTIGLGATILFGR